MTLDEVLLGVKNQSNIDISCSHSMYDITVIIIMNFMVFLSCLANFPRITLQQQIIQTLSGYFINKLHQSSVHLIIVCLILIPAILNSIQHSVWLISFNFIHQISWINCNKLMLNWELICRIRLRLNEALKLNWKFVADFRNQFIAPKHSWFQKSKLSFNWRFIKLCILLPYCITFT